MKERCRKTTTPPPPPPTLSSSGRRSCMTLELTSYIVIPWMQDHKALIFFAFSAWGSGALSTDASCCIDRNRGCTHCPCSHGHDNASEEGQVVAGVHSVPHGRQQEGGSGGVDGAALIAHPGVEDQQFKTFQKGNEKTHKWTAVTRSKQVLPFKPKSCLDVPVVEETLETCGELKYYPQRTIRLGFSWKGLSVDMKRALVKKELHLNIQNSEI